MRLPTHPHLPAQSAGDDREPVLLELERLAQRQDRLDHTVSRRGVARALRAAGRLVHGEDPAVIAAEFDAADGDQRRRVLDAADVLLAVLDEACGCRELQHMRGDLKELRDRIRHMRQAVAGRPDISEFWM